MTCPITTLSLITFREGWTTYTNHAQKELHWSEAGWILSSPETHHLWKSNSIWDIIEITTKNKWKWFWGTRCTTHNNITFFEKKSNSNARAGTNLVCSIFKNPSNRISLRARSQCTNSVLKKSWFILFLWFSTTISDSAETHYHLCVWQAIDSEHMLCSFFQLFLNCAIHPKNP